MKTTNNEQRIMNNGGSLPLAPASSVAALPAVASATPSPGLRPGPLNISLEVMV
jgi:hypothetical protein